MPLFSNILNSIIKVQPEHLKENKVEFSEISAIMNLVYEKSYN